MIAHLLAVAALGLAPGVLSADDDVRSFKLPQLSDDWRFGAEGVAVSDERVAISGITYGRPSAESVPRITRSVIVQYGDDAPPPIELESKALARGFAADGKTLLVSQIVPDDDRPCEGCPLRYLLFGADGTEIWRSDVQRDRFYSFVPDREAIYAGAACGYTTCTGEILELRDLRGVLLARVGPGERFSASIPLGDGTDFVLFYDGAIERLGVVGRVTHRWQISHEVGDRFLERAPRSLADGTIVFRIDGTLNAIDPKNGEIRSWSAERLAALDEHRSADDYRLIAFDAGPTESTLWIENNTGDRLLDLGTMTIREVAVDRSGPEGYVSPHETPMVPYRSGRNFVFIDRKNIFIRPIWKAEDRGE